MVTLQDFIHELIREKFFENEEVLSGFQMYAASEKALGKAWLSKEADDAWAHLQEKT